MGLQGKAGVWALAASRSALNGATPSLGAPAIATESPGSQLSDATGGAEVHAAAVVTKSATTTSLPLISPPALRPSIVFPASTPRKEHGGQTRSLAQRRSTSRREES